MPDPYGYFPRTFNAAATRSDIIHFNLEGIGNGTAEGYINYAENFSNHGMFLNPGERQRVNFDFHVTAWELYTIRHTPSLCRKTFFYREGNKSFLPSLELNSQICAGQ
ncbi:MAG: hypothetical protein F9K28_11040 [Bacteroidetes bacterium]|nr:MAG: hypothetical protein F9K28_11040 [Bacteroidota bacterium]